MSIDINEDYFCCGIREITGISRLTTTPKTVVEEIYYDRFVNNEHYAFVIFTDIENMARGKAIAEFIRKVKLGTITSTLTRVNPNTSHPLKVGIWGINSKAFKAWGKRNLPQYNDELYNDD